jgi:hypothetical protein
MATDGAVVSLDGTKSGWECSEGSDTAGLVDIYTHFGDSIVSIMRLEECSTFSQRWKAFHLPKCWYTLTRLHGVTCHNHHHDPHMSLGAVTADWIYV